MDDSGGPVVIAGMRMQIWRERRDASMTNNAFHDPREPEFQNSCGDDEPAAGLIEQVSALPETDVIEIRDPEIDIQEIVTVIRRRSVRRKPLPPSAASLGRAQMARQRKRIIVSLKELKSRIRDFGVVESHKQGWLAKVDLFAKRSVRKLMQRHILQQHRIHLKLHTVLDQLIQYLQDEDVNLRACVDRAEREAQLVGRKRKRRGQIDRENVRG